MYLYNSVAANSIIECATIFGYSFNVVLQIRELVVMPFVLLCAYGSSDLHHFGVMSKFCNCAYRIILQ